MKNYRKMTRLAEKIKIEFTLFIFKKNCEYEIVFDCIYTFLKNILMYSTWIIYVKYIVNFNLRVLFQKQIIK